MSAESRPLRVLLVDDEALSRWSLGETLRDRGEMVVAVADAAGAHKAIGAAPEPFDVILLDYWLPDSRDLGLLKALRLRLPGCPVILISARTTPEIGKEAVEAGAYCALAKPVEISEIAALVRQAHLDGHSH